MPNDGANAYCYGKKILMIEKKSLKFNKILWLFHHHHGCTQEKNEKNVNRIIQGLIFAQ